MSRPLLQRQHRHRQHQRQHQHPITAPLLRRDAPRRRRRPSYESSTAGKGTVILILYLQSFHPSPSLCLSYMVALLPPAMPLAQLDASFSLLSLS